MYQKHRKFCSRAALGAVVLLYAFEAPASETITYTYDAQGRLVTTAHSGSVNNNAETEYSFDATDNRTNVTITNAASRVIVVPLNGFTIIPVPDP